MFIFNIMTYAFIFYRIWKVALLQRTSIDQLLIFFPLQISPEVFCNTHTHMQSHTHHVILSEVNGGVDGLLSFSHTQKSALGAGRGTWQLLACCQDRLVWHDSIRRSARQTGSGEFCRMPYEIPIALGYTHTPIGHLHF